MNKTILVAALLIVTCNAEASVAKGQKAYLKQCKSCHGNGAKGAAMHTQSEWEELFKDQDILVKKHATATGFDEAAFRGSAKDLKDFLYEYGSDSGNMPACG